MAKGAEAARKDDDRRLNTAIRAAVSGMKPPDCPSVWQWADAKRRLSMEYAAEPGPWRTSRTPYLREIMDAFTDAKTRRIVFVSSSQTGKSELLNNIIGYIIDQDPGSILFIHPTNIDAKEYSKLRIAPMIRDCASLREKVAAPKSRDSSNTVLQKAYPGGLLTMCGSTEAHALASKPIRYVIGDERDRWAYSAGKEGDPWTLAMARQITFYNAKAVEVSTPTIKGASAIEESFKEGTMERWCVECPHCGGWHDIKFADIRFEYATDLAHGKKRHTVSEIWHACPGCGSASEEREIKGRPAKWVAENPGSHGQGTRSFWLNSFVSPWATWGTMILEYLNAKGSTAKMQVVKNTRFGELWEDRGGIEDEGGLMARREEYPAELPEGVLVLTAGVDTQDDRFEYEVVGHGHFGETWGIEAGIIMGRPDDCDTWTRLDEAVFSRTFRFEGGVGLRVSMSFVDEGGHFTQDVRQQCRERFGMQVFAIAGLNRHDAPFTAPPRKQKIVVRKKIVGYCWRYGIGVDAGKQLIMDNLRVKSPGARYCHFPRRDDYGSGYFSRLLSERLTYKEGRKQPWQWEKIPGHDRNEALDCRNYALAAYKALPADLDGIERRLKAAKRGETAPTPVPVAPAQQQRPKQRGGGRALEKHYDEW